MRERRQNGQRVTFKSQWVMQKALTLSALARKYFLIIFSHFGGAESLKIHHINFTLTMVVQLALVWLGYSTPIDQC